MRRCVRLLQALIDAQLDLRPLLISIRTARAEGLGSAVLGFVMVADALTLHIKHLIHATLKKLEAICDKS